MIGVLQPGAVQVEVHIAEAGRQILRVSQLHIDAAGQHRTQVDIGLHDVAAGREAGPWRPPVAGARTMALQYAGLPVLAQPLRMFAAGRTLTSSFDQDVPVIEAAGEFRQEARAES